MKLERRSISSSSISLHSIKNGSNQSSRRPCCWRLLLLPFLALTCVAATTQQRQHSVTATSAKEAWALPAFVPKRQEQKFAIINQQQQQDGRTPFSTRHKSLIVNDSFCLNEFLLRFRGGSSDRNGGSGSGGPSSYYNSNDYYQGSGQPGKAGPADADDNYDDNNDDRGYYNDDDYDYDDRGLDRPPSRRRDQSSNSNAASGNQGNNNMGGAVSSFLDSIMPNIVKTGNRRIGFMLLSGGAILTMLGISLFFNKALLRMGNLLFIAGVPMTMGPSRVMSYFLQAQKMRATACLAFGIFLVLVGSPVLGMCLEIFGLLNLFGNMFPVLLAIAKQMPVIGPILSGSGSSSGGSNSRRSNNNNNRRRQEEDDYYYQDDDQSYYNEGDGWRDDGGGGSGDRYY